MFIVYNLRLRLGHMAPVYLKVRCAFNRPVSEKRFHTQKETKRRLGSLFLLADKASLIDVLQ